jgi:hypothetical protein
MGIAYQLDHLKRKATMTTERWRRMAETRAVKSN